MAAAGFSIVIQATDRATARIDAINKRLAAMRAPAERMQKAMARFAEVSGLRRVSEGFRNLARSSLSVFRSMARIVEPLAAITGAASLAGMYRLVSAWGEWGTRLGNTAQNMGVHASQLATWQGAARLAGSSAQAMTSGMQSLGKTLYDAVGGRNAAAVSMFNLLGVNWKKDATHARDLVDVLPEVADGIARMNGKPYEQAQAASVLFGGAAEDLLPVLRLGSAGIAKLSEEARKYLGVSDDSIEKARQMQRANTALAESVEGLGYRIAERLAPTLVPLLNQFSNWIATSPAVQQGIDRVAGAVQKFATWLQGINWAGVEKDVASIWHTADSVAQAFGGWQKVIEGILALKLAGWVTGQIGAIAPLLQALALIPGSGVTAAALGALGIGAVATGVGVQAMNKGAEGRGYMIDPELGPIPMPGAPAAGGKPDPGPLKFTPPDWMQNGLHWLAPKWYEAAPSRPRGPPGPLAKDIEAEVRRRAAEHRLDPNHMVALARTEGGGKSKVSPAGAIGTMQLMPGTAREVGVNPYEWHQNVEGGMRYYERLLARFHGSYPAADAAYNAGPGNAGVRRFAASGDMRGLPAETRNYVTTIHSLEASAPEAKLDTPDQSVATLRGSADLNITVNGPPGTKTTATTKGDLFNTPRIGQGLQTSFAGG